MQEFWRDLALVMVVAHFAFLAYLVVGGFLAWRWRWTIAAHVLAAIWAVLIVTVGLECPLTWLQNELRERGGQQPLDGGFIADYVTGYLYPGDLEILAQALVALVVLGSWAGLAVRTRRRERSHSAAA